jgi:hypothetical protein
MVSSSRNGFLSVRIVFMKQIFESDREFRIWDYTISHKTLLIRSSKYSSGGHEFNIDIQFSNVVWMNLPSDFKEIVVSQIDSEDVVLSETNKFRHGGYPPIYCVMQDKDVMGFVVCSYVTVEFNTMEIDETSLEGVGKVGNRGERGQVIVRDP